MKQLIDRNEVLEFLKEKSGFWEYVRLINDNYDINETEALNFADEIKDTIQNVIESMEVIKEQEDTVCSIWKDYPGDYPIFHYTCCNCSESITSGSDDEEYKFCPYCGARYTEIKKDE